MSPHVLLGDDPNKLLAVATAAGARYGIGVDLTTADYWLTATLWSWTQNVGFGPIQRPYPNPGKTAADNSVGTFQFGGGTALSACWDVTQRWSEDIDLVLDLAPGVDGRYFKQTCKQAFGRTGRGIGGTFVITEKSSNHSFASFSKHQSLASHIDVTAARIGMPSLKSQMLPVRSMIGRTADKQTLGTYPELGGFKVRCLDPNITVMNKLLAQTKIGLLGQPRRIVARARDIYDLACAANHKQRLGLLNGEAARQILRWCESNIGPDAPKRPAEGFAALPQFDSITRAYESLAQGYEDVCQNMVWGNKIPLKDAISAAISLDPGP